MDVTPSPVPQLRPADIGELENALVAAFDESGIKRLTHTLLDVRLDHIVALSGRNLVEIVQDLVMWARENPEIGVRGLLDAACAQNPNHPDLRILRDKWQGRVDAAALCPYPGMQPYREGDNLEFCGRGDEIIDARYRLANHPFLVVIGPSGSGKSSLVFAGIVPAMRRDPAFGPGPLLLCTVRPGAAPLAALAAAFPGPEGAPLSTAEDVLAAALVRQTAADAASTVLVVDQYEEVFSAEEGQASAFQQTLVRMVGLPKLYIIVTVRADFYSSLAGSPIWHEFRRSRLELETLKGDALRAAIVSPAASAGVKLDDDLVGELLHDAADQPGALPFLQTALALLWRRVVGFRIRLEAYHRLADSASDSASDFAGDSTLSLALNSAPVSPRFAAFAPRRTGLQVAMAQWADQCYTELTAEQRTLARVIFLRLVQFGQGRPDTRRRLPAQEICPAPALKPQFDATLAVLVGYRLLTADSDATAESGAAGHDAQRRIDIAHEALLTGWPMLAQWIKEARAAEQARRRLADKADEWQRLGGGTGGLLDELQLREAELWVKDTAAALVLPDEKIQGLLTASRTEIARQQKEEKIKNDRTLALLQERNSRQRLLLVGAFVFLCFAGGALLYILNQQAQLAAQLSQARSREVAAIASNLADGGDTEEALLLGLVAQYGIARTAQAEEVVRRAVDAWRGVRTLAGHTLPVTSLFFSRDNRYLVTGGGDKTARVWDWQAGKLLWTLGGHGYALTGAVISLDNKYVITASKEDGLVRIWRMADGALLHELKHDDNVRSVALHPNGQWLGVRVGPKVALWDIATGLPVELSPYGIASGAQLRALTWTMDADQMLAGADDNLAHIIDIRTGNQGNLNLGEGKGHQSYVSSVQQSPDRRYIASMSSDLLELWQWIETPEGGRFEYIELPDARNSEGYRTQLQFSPDGRYLAAGSANGKVRVWNMHDTAAQPIQLVGHTQEINGLNFSPDGKTLATGSRDGLVLLWNLRTQSPTVIVRTQPGNVSAPVFDRSGEVLATSDNSGAVHLWRVRLGGNIGSYYPAGVPAQALAVADDVLYIAGENGALERFDALQGMVDSFDLGDARLTAVARTGDARIVVGDEAGAITILDPQARRLITWVAHGGPVRGLVVLRDNTVVSAGGDVTVRQWRLDTGAPLGTYGGHTNDIRALAVDPVTGHLWSAAADGQVLEHVLGAPAPGDKVAPLRTLTAGPPLISLALGPDGHLLAAGDSAARLHVWDLQSGVYWTQKTTRPLASMVFVTPGQLVTGDEGGQLHFWDLAPRTAVTVQAHPERRTVRALAVFAGGRLLASLGDDGEVKIWPLREADVRSLACARAGRKLLPEEWNDLFTFAADIDVCAGVSPGTAAGETGVDGDSLPLLPVVSGAEIEESGADGGDASGLPLIYTFEALSGTVVAPGAPVVLRWNTQNATGGVFLGVNGSEPQPVGSPGQQTFTFAGDSTVLLAARNDIGEQTMEVHLDVRGVPPGE